MSTQEVETEEQESPAQEPVRIADCGSITQQTRGIAWYGFLEGGVPPFDKTFFPG